MEAWMGLTEALARWEWIGVLLARIAVGLLFAVSGAGKLFVTERREEMRSTMREAGIPAPEASAAVVSSIELVFGVCLVLGLLTPLSCLALAAVMLVALATILLPGIEAESPAGWLGEVLYLPEVLYLVILIWIFLAGPGWFSLDHLILSR